MVISLKANVLRSTRISCLAHHESHTHHAPHASHLSSHAHPAPLASSALLHAHSAAAECLAML